MAVVAKERIPANVANQLCAKHLRITSSKRFQITTNLLRKFLAKLNFPLEFAKTGELCRQTWQRQRQWPRQRHGANTGIVKSNTWFELVDGFWTEYNLPSKSFASKGDISVTAYWLGIRPYRTWNHLKTHRIKVSPENIDEKSTGKPTSRLKS